MLTCRLMHGFLGGDARLQPSASHPSALQATVGKHGPSCRHVGTLSLPSSVYFHVDSDIRPFPVRVDRHNAIPALLGMVGARRLEHTRKSSRFDGFSPWSLLLNNRPSRQLNVYRQEPRSTPESQHLPATSNNLQGQACLLSISKGKSSRISLSPAFAISTRIARLLLLRLALRS